MKNKYLLIVALVFACTGMGMELPEKPAEQVSFGLLPEELKEYILLHFAHANTAEEARGNILRFMKIYPAFAYDKITNGYLINELADTFYEGNRVQAAIALGTPGARAWLANYLAEEKKVGQVARSPLFDALHANNNKVVIFLINTGINPNTRDIRLGRTPLMVVAGKGNLLLINFLLEKGANIDQQDKQGMSPLMYATRNGENKAVALLVEKGASLDLTNKAHFTALYWAIHKSHPEIAAYLIAHNAAVDIPDTNGDTPLMETAKHELPKIAQLLLSKGANVNAQNLQGKTALLFAASTENSKLVKILLDGGANPNISNNDQVSPLMLATKNLDNDTLKLLFEKGADPLDPDNRLLLFRAIRSLKDDPASIDSVVKVVRTLLMNNVDPNLTDQQGDTPLNIVLTNANAFTQLIRLLINTGKGTDLNKPNNAGITPLMIAAQHKSILAPARNLKTLLEFKNKINLNAQEPNAGLTALHLAVGTGNAPAVQLLLEAGADRNIPAKDGKTPLETAINNGEKEITGMLETVQKNIINS